MTQFVIAIFLNIFLMMSVDNRIFANNLEDSGYTLAPYEYLSPYWQNYFQSVDENIKENFWGNLSALKKTKLFKDPYISQMESMGYNFDDGCEKPASFYQSIQWIFQELEQHITQGRLAENEVLWPAKAFEIEDQGKKSTIFIPLGHPVPGNAIPLNLLSPEVFVCMLSSGFFPIGNAEREHTNQSLAEHDLAHMAAFVSSPRFTKSVRKAFTQVGEKMNSNPRVYKALQEFDSCYSLRLYYTIEIFTGIPKQSLQRLQELIEIPLDSKVSKKTIDDFLLKKAEDPAKLYEYLAKLYWEFHHLVNPLGGESRDVLNRRRKFHRDGTLGTFYDKVSKTSSKFARNSIYSLFLNAKSALENKRSNHPDFIMSVTEIHSPLIGAIIGTSQLEIEDWVLGCIEEVPDPQSKLYQYIHDTGLWEENHFLYQAFCDPEYDKLLKDE